MPLAEIALKGAHNVENVLAAVAIGPRFLMLNKGILLEHQHSASRYNVRFVAGRLRQRTIRLDFLLDGGPPVAG